MSATFDIGLAEAASPSVTQSRPRSTIAISAALLVTSCFIAVALVCDPPAPPAAQPNVSPARPPALRASLVPDEFSCPGENCAATAIKTAASGLPRENLPRR